VTAGWFKNKTWLPAPLPHTEPHPEPAYPALTPDQGKALRTLEQQEEAAARRAKHPPTPPQEK